ncbi:hypothetical protein, partial [Psychromonas antarctica]|uniref:hypothetical protein n=1 Tax=Psychromonas antarctica TaxID=67573 RepID=UPI001EE911BC
MKAEHNIKIKFNIDFNSMVSLRLHSLTWAVSPIQSFLESKSAVTHYFLDNSMAGNFLGWL